ncbi:MAG TPA: hypothetical protein VJZ27_05890 [Aggregatilineales bacterium]|nr:hypothetical protein [Aggregatilineales bacterium]
MKRFFLALIVALAIPVIATVQAQGAATIEYGQVVTGTISNEQFEVPYTFQGTQGDVIIIQLSPVDILADLDQPAVILLDSNSGMLTSSDSFGTVTLAARLPADGAYTILATRADGRAGTSIGEFNLSLMRPPVLESGSQVEGSATSTGGTFFVYESGASFLISYNKTSGDFSPQLLVNRIGSSNELEEVASLSGVGVTGGQIAIAGTGSVASTTYVIVFQEALFDFNFEEVSANFTLVIKASE